MIDYKLVLILVLSIVLLFIYNKVEELRDDVNEIRKSNNKEKNIYISAPKKENTSNELLKLFKTQNLGVINNNKNDLSSKNICNDEIYDLSSKNICNDEKCDLQDRKKEDLNQLPSNLNMNNELILNDNTDSYNATDISDSLDINYEKSTSENNTYVVYSNEKDNKIQNDEVDNNKMVGIDVDNVLECIQQKNDIFINNGSNIMINEELLNSNPNSDLIKDLSNSDKNEINLEDTHNILSNDNALYCDDIMKELDNIQILENNNGKIIIKTKDNIIESDTTSENKYEDLKNESIDELINTSEFKKISLNSITKYKLNDLQNLAKKFDIIITKEKNGKSLNKTKNELYNDLTVFKEN